MAAAGHRYDDHDPEAASWADVVIGPYDARRTQTCHPERSEAESKDLALLAVWRYQMRRRHNNCQFALQ